MWPVEARYIWYIMNIWILWNIRQTLCGLRKPDILEILWIFEYCEIFDKPCVACGSPRAARMTTKIKENIFTGYPSHLRIIMIMIMVIIMITSGGDGYKIIKNDHLTLSTTILISLLVSFSVALDKTPSHWQILEHVFHELSMQSHPLQVVYKQTVYYSVVKFHKTKAIWVEVGLR